MSAASLRVLASPAASGLDGNPYVDLLFDGVRSEGLQVRGLDRRRLLSRPHIVHVHWPAALVRWDSAPVAVLDALKVLVLLLIARLRGARLVWTAHDLAPHELRHPRLFALYFAAFGHMVDLWISLSEAGAEQLRQRYPVLRRRPLRVIPHGSYRSAYGARPEREDADAALDLPRATAASFLLIGQLRRYKNALPLLRAFTAGHPRGERLLIAGEPRGDDALLAAMAATAAGHDDVVLRPARVAEHDVAAWLGAADVVVLPYDDRSALNSGALLLALSLDVPVVVADSPVNRELRDAVGADWVRLFRGDPDDALAAARALAARPRSGRPDLSAFDWPRIAAATVLAYRDVASGRA